MTWVRGSQRLEALEEKLTLVATPPTATTPEHVGITSAGRPLARTVWSSTSRQSPLSTTNRETRGAAGGVGGAATRSGADAAGAGAGGGGAGRVAVLTGEGATRVTAVGIGAHGPFFLPAARAVPGLQSPAAAGIEMPATRNARSARSATRHERIESMRESSNVVHLLRDAG